MIPSALRGRAEELDLERVDMPSHSIAKLLGEGKYINKTSTFSYELKTLTTIVTDSVTT